MAIDVWVPRSPWSSRRKSSQAKHITLDQGLAGRACSTPRKMALIPHIGSVSRWRRQADAVPSFLRAGPQGVHRRSRRPSTARIHRLALTSHGLGGRPHHAKGPKKPETDSSHGLCDLPGKMKFAACAGPPADEDINGDGGGAGEDSAGSRRPSSVGPGPHGDRAGDRSRRRPRVRP